MFPDNLVKGQDVTKLDCHLGSRVSKLVGLFSVDKYISSMFFSTKKRSDSFVSTALFVTFFPPPMLLAFLQCQSNKDQPNSSINSL